MSGLTLEQATALGFHPGPPAQSQAPPSGGGSTMGYQDLRALAQFAGADPNAAGIMARIALAESSGNPQSNANHKTSYVEKGKTYYPEGLWQISTVHGTGGGGMFNALANARQAVKLFNDQGFGPWEASRHGGAGGGWDQYLQPELGLPPGSHYSRPRHGMGGGANDEFYAGMVADQPQGMTADQVLSGATPAPASGGGGMTAEQVTAGASPSPTDTGGGLTAAQVQAGHTPGPQYQSAGLAQIPRRVFKDVRAFVSRQPVEANSPVGRAVEEFNSNFNWVVHQPWPSMLNVLGTSSRMGMSVTTDIAAHKDPGTILKDLWHSVWDASDHEVNKLTTGMEHIAHNSPLNLPEHEAIDAWIKDHVPKELQGQVGMIFKGVEDFGAQSVADPLTYSGLGDVVKGAELLKLIHPMFAGGRIALWGWKVAKASKMGDYFTHLRTMSKDYDDIVTNVGKFFDMMKTRPDLDRAGLSGESKKVRIQIENRATQSTQASVEAGSDALRSGDPAQVKQAFLKWYAEHGSKDNAAAARQVHGYAGPKVKPTGTLREANLKDALTEFMEKEHPDETPAQLLERRQQTFQKMRDQVERSQAETQTDAYLKRFGTPAEKKINVAKLAMGSREAATIGKGLENFPVFRLLRDWQRATIKFNPFPHALKNVGTLAYLAGGPRAIVRGLINGAEDAAKATYSGTEFGRWAGQTKLSRLQNMAAAAPEYAYEGESLGGNLRRLSSSSMVRIENGWRQALLEMQDRIKPTRWGTEFEDKDELLKGAIINDRLGDYRNQAAFVRLFEAMGGPFVAFRMGIVPRNVALAIKENPARVMAMVRAEYNLQSNRKGHNANELQGFGPPEDFAKMVFNPAAYVQTTLGAPDVLQQFTGTGEALSQIGRRLGRQYVPGYSILDEAAQIGTGTAMPGPGPHLHQNMTLPDQLAVSVLMALGMYFHEKQLPQTQRAEDTAIHHKGP